MKTGTSTNATASPSTSTVTSTSTSTSTATSTVTAEELLRDFTLITNLPKPFITLNDRQIAFSKLALEGMGEPTTVLTYVRDADGLVAFKAGRVGRFGGEDGDKYIGDKLKAVNGKLIRICDVNISKRLMKMAGIKDCEKGIRFYGTFCDGVLVIDMKQWYED